jgi:beta-aspartyl-peptidase (threonine type)
MIKYIKNGSSKKIAIAIHGGAEPDSAFVRTHLKEYEEGLRKAVSDGYEVLKKRGTAVDAVETAVNELENNALFNAGKGSALNEKGEVEMCSSIMDGKTLRSGAVAIVKNVKNPVSLARSIMEESKFIYLGDKGALSYAQEIKIALRPDAYFITEHQYNEFEKAKKTNNVNKLVNEAIYSKMHGTVGAVALDHNGHIAAATSTGGTVNCKEGRIGDSSMIGIGTYADDNTCAVSGTGDGEYLIRGVIAHSVAMAIRYGHLSLQEACDYIVHSENKDIEGDLGIIAINKEGQIVIKFNSDLMHRAWIGLDGVIKVGIYK